MSAPLRAVRISGITRSNSAVGLIDARGLTTDHSRHILTGILYRQGLAWAVPVPSKQNERCDIRALFQRRGPFCLCLISLWEKWKEGQPISLGWTAVHSASYVSAPQRSLSSSPILYRTCLLSNLWSQETLQFWLEENEIQQHWGPFRLKGQKVKTEWGRNRVGDRGEGMKNDFGTKQKKGKGRRSKEKMTK